MNLSDMGGVLKYEDQSVLVTILTPTFNCASTIPATLACVEALQAKFPHKIQHLVGDANSTDGTLELLQTYLSRNSWAELHLLPGMNIPATLNALLPNAIGRWIAVLNGDDHYVVDAMAAWIEHIGLLDEAVILCADIETWTQSGDFIGTRLCRLDRLDDYMAVNHQAMLAHRSVFNLLQFDPSTPTNYDYVWLWRLHRKGVPLRYYPGIVAVMRLGGISQTRAIIAAREIFQVRLAEAEYRAAWVNYLLFLLKWWVKSILPAWLLAPLIRNYRRLKGSGDLYSS